MLLISCQLHNGEGHRQKRHPKLEVVVVAMLSGCLCQVLHHCIQLGLHFLLRQLYIVLIHIFKQLPDFFLQALRIVSADNIRNLHVIPEKLLKTPAVILTSRIINANFLKLFINGFHCIRAFRKLL